MTPKAEIPPVRAPVREPADRYVAWLGFGAAAVCAVQAAQLPPVSDHAYQFWMAEQILDGARMYVDVGAADMHPPLFTWLATALAATGRMVGVPGLVLYPVAAAMALLASLVWAWRLGLPAPLLVAGVVAFLPLAGPAFAQGEHLALFLALPYVTAAVAAAPGGRRRPVAVRMAIAATAALGLAMKPYFALVWVGVEFYRTRSHGPNSLLRLENWVMGGLFLLYVLLTAVFTPEFFRMLPWLAALYPRYEPAPAAFMVANWRVALLIAAIVSVRVMRLEGAERRMADALSIAAVAMYAAVLAQGKGWGYHWYPVIAASLMLVVLALVQCSSKPVRRRQLMFLLCAVAVLWMPFRVAGVRTLTAAPPGSPAEVADVVAGHGGGASWVAYSHLLNAGFPVTNELGATWASPYGHLWMVPAIYRSAWSGRAPWRYGASGRWRAREREILDRLWQAAVDASPGVVLLLGPQGNGFDMQAWLSTDERFARWLARAEPVDVLGGYFVLRMPPPDNQY